MKQLLILLFVVLSFAATAQTRSGSDTLTATATIIGGNGTGTIVSYAWSVTGPGTGVFESPNSVTTKFTVVVPGTYAATVKVTDNLGNTASYTVNIPAWFSQGVSVSAAASRPGIIIN